MNQETFEALASLASETFSETKVLCDGANCKNYLTLPESYGLLDLQMKSKEVERTATRYGWRNKSGKLYCRFCFGKQRR